MKRLLFPLMALLLLTAFATRSLADSGKADIIVGSFVENALGGLVFNERAAAYGLRYSGNAYAEVEDGRVVYYIRDREFLSSNPAPHVVFPLERRLAAANADFERTDTGGFVVYRVPCGGGVAVISLDAVTGVLFYYRGSGHRGG